MKPEELLGKIVAFDGDPSANVEALKDYILICAELLALWKATSTFMKMNRMTNNNIAGAASDTLAHKAEWDAKVAMADALKALEAK